MKMGSHDIWSLSLLRRTQTQSKPAPPETTEALTPLNENGTEENQNHTVGSAPSKSYPYPTTQCYVGFSHLIHFPLLEVMKKYFNELWIRYLGMTTFRRIDLLEYK